MIINKKNARKDQTTITRMQKKATLLRKMTMNKQNNQKDEQEFELL
jgi:hypothetical protein